MKKVTINFKELNVEVGVDRFESQDWRKTIGDALHRASESVPMTELARKIYYSEEPIDISEEDFKVMLALLGTALKRYIVAAVAEAGTTGIKNKE